MDNIDRDTGGLMKLITPFTILIRISTKWILLEK